MLIAKLISICKIGNSIMLKWKIRLLLVVRLSSRVMNYRRFDRTFCLHLGELLFFLPLEMKEIPCCEKWGIYNPAIRSNKREDQKPQSSL
jgi:hypothetical protein